jgi:DedD protein
MTTLQYQRIIGVVLLFSVILAVAMLLIRSAHNGIAINDSGQKEVLDIKPDYAQVIEPYTTEAIINLDSDTQGLNEVAIVKPAIEIKTNLPVPVPVQTSNSGAEIPTVQNESEPAWVIQLASFSVKENAAALSTQVKKMGYKSVIQSKQGTNGKIYRVRLEPLSNKKKAQALASVLNQKFKLSTQILQK